MDFFSLRAARFRFGDWRYLLSMVMVRSVSLFFCILSDFHSPQRTLGRCRGRWTWELGRSILPVCLDKFRPVASQSQSRFFASALSALFHNAVLLGMRTGKWEAVSSIGHRHHKPHKQPGHCQALWAFGLYMASASASAVRKAF